MGRVQPNQQLICVSDTTVEFGVALVVEALSDLQLFTVVRREPELTRGAVVNSINHTPDAVAHISMSNFVN